ncbi:MAG: BPSS1780 family membrane protein [Rubrivivax sp.]|jgi:hypothetical protein|nr:hypothetical protein [Rubrivivax sp.]
MPLSLRVVPARQGVTWMRDGFRLFAKHPLQFSLMFVVFLVTVVLGAMLPALAGLMIMAAAPLFGLGFMLAAESALNKGPIHPGLFIKPLMVDAKRRQALLLIAAAYGLCMFVALALGQWADGGSMLRLQQLQAEQASPDEIAALMSTPEFRNGLFIRLLLISVVSAVFWHAPALVHWGGQGTAQAVFSSVVAVWRNRGAYIVFMLSWLGIAILFGSLTALALAVLGLQNLAGMVIIPGALIFSTVYFVSMLFPFNDCFGNSAPAP